MGVFSKTIEWIGEDYMRLEDNGETIITRQLCKHLLDNTMMGQYLVGRKRGTSAPKRQSLLHFGHSHDLDHHNSHDHGKHHA